MINMLVGVFVDRETADHAVSELEKAGFEASRSNAEDFGSPEYYKQHLPQGRTLVSVAVLDRVAEAQAILLRMGAEGMLDDDSIDMQRAYKS